MAAERLAFQSVTGQALEAYIWRPEGEITAVVQLVHGMAEHIMRYDALAAALNKASFLVVGHTHLGHGQAAPIKGFFGEKEGVHALVEDIHGLRLLTQTAHKGVPYFILGHSMGSFLTRRYMKTHAQGLAGVILSGTGHYTKNAVDAGLLLSNLLILLGQGKKPSPLIQRVTSMGNLKRIAGAKTAFDWLSTDGAQVQKYVDDANCGFAFTPYGYRDLFSTLKSLLDMEGLKTIPQELPVYLFSGTDDPIGGWGTGVGWVAAQLRKAGLQKVEVRLYKNGRHEMLNEVNVGAVHRDLIQWLYNHLA